MELLKKIPFNFRYYLFTTTSKDIIVVYYKSESDIEESTSTMLETTYLPIFRKKYDFDESQTIKFTCTDDEMQLKDFNIAIRDYCAARKDYNEFKFYSASPSYEILFEEETMNSIFTSCKKIYLELGFAGGWRTSKREYNQLESIEVKSGNWFIDGETTIYVNDFKAVDLTINVYNKSKTSSVFNLVVGNTFKGSRLRLYSTVQFSVLNSSKTQEQFMNGKINFAVINIFGEEILDDNEQARIEIRGFEKVNIASIDIEDEVKYGNILYLDNITKFSLMRLRRLVNEVDKGSFIQVDRVGTVNLHDIQYTLGDKCMLLDGAAVVKFLHNDDDSLERSLNVYDTILNNESGRNIIICKVVNTEIKKVYISKCTLSNNVVMVEKDENSKVTKFNYNECTFTSTGDFEICDIVKISLNNITFNVDGEVKISSPNISINGGSWNIGKLTIDNENETIGKIVMNDLELVAKTVEINNSTMVGEEDFTFYDNSCKLKVDNYHIAGYKPTFNGTTFMCDNVEIECLSITIFSKAKVSFKNSESVFTVKSSMSGIIMFATESSETDKKFILNLEDQKFYMNVNTVDFIGTNSTPELHFNSNTPIKFTLNNLSPDYVYFAYTKAIESVQKSKIIYKMNVLDIQHQPVVINDSEKYCTISNYTDSNYSQIFEIEKK